MVKVISVANRKGGIGKSTTAQSMSSGLVLKGYKVLLIDLDEQGNTTYTTKVDEIRGTIFDVLTQRCKIEDAIISTDEFGDLIPASDELSTLDMVLVRQGKEYKLKEALVSVKDKYDFIIIDTPPALGVSTTNALTASDSVLIPLLADSYSLTGISLLLEVIDEIVKYSNKDLKIEGMLLTRYNSRTTISKEILEMVKSEAISLNTIVYESGIREGVAISKAQAVRQSIFSYDPKSNVAKDYASVINEFLDINIGKE